jgi:hemolysin activation/secretion protein
VDQGDVKPASGSTSLPATLRGAGLGLAWQNAKGTEAKLTLARRVGHNPNPMTDGSDSDGTLKLNRVWFSLSSPF